MRGARLIRFKIATAIATARFRLSRSAPHLATGRFGEDLAVALLESTGCAILARNWKIARREVDIVALDGAQLIFVEVKTRKEKSLIEPTAALTPAVQRRLKEAARLFAARRKMTDCSVRFDVVMVTVDGKRARGSMRHIKNAF